MKEGTFFVVSGPSGSGKGTVLKKVLENHSDIKFSVSATTRTPRVNEVDGVNYFFKTREEFMQLIKQHELLEYTIMYNNFYGTLKSQIDDAVSQGKNIILEIDPVGARNVRFSYPEAVLIFLVAPSLDILKSRLIGRNSEHEKDLQNRIDSAMDEMENASLYDYIVVNKEVDVAANEINTIIEAENLKINKNLDILNKIKGGAEL